MTNEQQEKLKAMAAEEAAKFGPNVGTGIGLDPQSAQQEKCEAGSIYSTQPKRRESFRDRMQQNLRYAKDQARKVEAYSELEYLFDKHPDVARILDLIEEVQG